MDLHHIKAFGLAVYVPEFENLTKHGKIGSYEPGGAFVITEADRKEWEINYPRGFHNYSPHIVGTGEGGITSESLVHIVFSSVYFASTVSRFDKLVLYSVVRDST